MYQRGDIVLVPFPFTDLAATKKRPALIISNDLINGTNDFIIVMITSQDKGDLMQIQIEEEHTLPVLPKKSFVRCHRLATIDAGLVLDVIGKANNDLLGLVEEKIRLFISEETNQLFDIQIPD
jgi:mRNA interferase MazF